MLEFMLNDDFWLILCQKHNILLDLVTLLVKSANPLLSQMKILFTKLYVSL